MNPGLASAAPWPASVAGAPARSAPRHGGPSAVVAMLAGFLTAFTVSVVGEMPMGEIVLFLTAGWAVLCAILNHSLPGALFHRRYFVVLMVCQAVAMLGYVIADIAWHSALTDVARGWSRMIFLAIDFIALTYLFGRSPGNFMCFLGAMVVGDLVQAMAFGALFGDFWKFGLGVPLTYGVVFLAAFAGPLCVVAVSLALAGVHFVLDFRSVGGLCVGLAAVVSLQMLPRRFRAWLLPAGAAAALGLVCATYALTRDDSDPHRASRSDVDRESMLRAATDAIRESPIVGHGSWFSRSHVYDDFLEIREEAAKEAGIGGFLGPNEDPETVALHSQILVSLAEGGVLGGAFFIAFGIGVARTLLEQSLTQAWRRPNAVRILALLFAAWNLLMSPFSGAHRVNIAMVSALLLQMAAERTPAGPEGLSP